MIPRESAAFFGGGESSSGIPRDTWHSFAFDSEARKSPPRERSKSNVTLCGERRRLGLGAANPRHAPYLNAACRAGGKPTPAHYCAVSETRTCTFDRRRIFMTAEHNNGTLQSPSCVVGELDIKSSPSVSFGMTSEPKQFVTCRSPSCIETAGDR